MEASKPTVWLFRDGKPGHENQILGLVEALKRRVPGLDSRDVSLPHRESVSARWRRLRAARDDLPRPDLLVGAGHAVHLFLVWASLQHRAPSVVLMKPTLPERFFSFSIIPAHDLRPGSGTTRRRLVTRGAINRVRYDPEAKESRGLILIGGPSKECGWDGVRLGEQIRAVVSAAPDLEWTATDSRRTPAGFLETIRRTFPGVSCFPSGETGRDWLPAELARASVVWVTRDSVSMIYEALSGGACVGILDTTPRGRPGRSSRGIAGLVRDGWVTPWDRWNETGRVDPPPAVPAEADRCAAELLQRLGWNESTD